MTRFEKRILKLLADRPDGMSGSQLWLSLRWWEIFSSSLYGALNELETSGKIRGEWLSGPYPRTRVYHLV